VVAYEQERRTRVATKAKGPKPAKVRPQGTEPEEPAPAAEPPAAGR
jgi:hypothetical protein